MFKVNLTSMSLMEYALEKPTQCKKKLKKKNQSEVT